VSAMRHFGDHRQRFDRARTDAWRQEQLRKVRRPAIGCGCEGAMQAPDEHIACPDVMVRWHDEMRQIKLRGRSRRERGILLDDAVGAEIG
jgi:hypothetical protein